MAIEFATLRQARRSVTRRPALAAGVVLTLGLALAVNGALFSVMDGLLFRPLPFERPDELVAIDWRRTGNSLPEVAWMPEYYRAAAVDSVGPTWRPRSWKRSARTSRCWRTSAPMGVRPAWS